MLPLRSRRRQWLVDRRLQLRFVLFLVMQQSVVLVLFILFAASIDLQLNRLTDRLVRQQDLPQMKESLHRSSRTFRFLTVAVGAVALGGLATFAIHASNKLAGPSLRIRRLLAETAYGNTSQRPAFRRRDYLGDLAEALSSRVGRLDERVVRLKAEIPFLASVVHTFRSDLENGKLPLDETEVRRLETTLGNVASLWGRAAKDTIQRKP